MVAAVAGGAYFFTKGDDSKGATTVSGGKPENVAKDPSKGATPSTPIASPTVPEEAIPGEIRHFTGHVGEIRCLAVSPDGRLMLSGSMDHTVRLWDVETGKDLATVKMENAGDIPLAVSFLPGGTKRFAVGSGQSVFVYELDSKRVSKSIKLPGADALAFFPDGTRFCIGADRSLEIWDLERGEKIGRLSERPRSRRYAVCSSRKMAESSSPAMAAATWAANPRPSSPSFSGTPTAAGGSRFWMAIPMM